jgi:hypothetical protein
MVQRLGSPSFREREAASLALVQLSVSPLGHRVYPHLKRATRSPDLEVQRRAERVLERYYDVSPTSYPLVPWIDMLPADFPDRKTIIEQYLQQSRNVFGTSTAPDWWNYRYATQLFARDLLKRGQTRGQVQALLDRMVEGETEYKNRAAKKDPPRN